MKKIFLILSILLLSGCWNYRELNNLAITTGIAVDKAEEGIEITVMVANSQKNSSGSSEVQASNAVYTGYGKTFYEAWKDAAMAVSKQIYIGHIEVVVISEEIAKDGMNQFIDFLFRYPQTRNDFYMVIATNSKASDILKTTSPLDSISSQNVAKNLEITNKLQGFIYTVKFNEFIDNLITEGIEPVLPTIEIIGNTEEGNKEENIEQSQPETYLKLEMLGIFKDDKLLTLADKDSSKGINIINNKVSTTGLIVEYNNGYVVSEVSSLKTDIKIEDKKIIINTRITASIEEATTDVDLVNPNTIEEIKQKDIEEVKKLINSALELNKKNKTDIFGFGEMYYKTYPKKWNEIKDYWTSEYLPNMEYEINVEIKLLTKGSINNGIEVD